MPTETPGKLRELAELAERAAAGQLADSEAGLSSENMQHLLHELRVHQIELEMQNEQLRSAQLSLEFERSRYFDLYDLAPVAYCTLSDSGLILQANLTAATLLGTGRKSLLNQVFFRFVHASDRHAYYLHGQRLIGSGQPQTSELRMVKHDGSEFWVQIVSCLQKTPDGQLQQRVVISDVNEQRRLGQAQRKAELARSLLLAQEQFKQRFSHELHDRTSANLATLRLNLEVIVATAAHSRNTTQFSNCVADTWAVLEDTNHGIRDLCADLYPSVFELGGLTAAVQSYAQSIHKRTGLAVQVVSPQPTVDLPNDLELTLFRVVQEALTNCIKHAHAGVVVVNLQLDKHPLQISISDDGIGLDQLVSGESSTHGLGQRPGQGLRNMRQAAEFFNAIFRIDSTLGIGTRISLEIPYPFEELRS